MQTRKFWRENLPRVQFFNPSLPITVIRVEPEAGEAKQVPAVLKVEFSTYTRSHCMTLHVYRGLVLILTLTTEDGEVKKVDVKHKHSSEILKLFVKMTGATPAEEIVHTPQL